MCRSSGTVLNNVTYPKGSVIGDVLVQDNDDDFYIITFHESSTEPVVFLTQFGGLVVDLVIIGACY